MSRVRAPRQQRSRDSLERVLAAGIDLLAEQGWEGFTMAGVAKAAGVSVGMIYGRFEDKDALFEAIHDRFMSQVVALHAERFDVASWRSLPTEDVIRLGVDAMAAGFAYNATVLRVSMLRSAVDTTIKARGSRAIDDLAGRFEAALLERRGDFAHAQPELGVAVCFRLVFATLSRRIMFGPLSEGSAEPEWDDPGARARLGMRRPADASLMKLAYTHGLHELGDGLFCYLQPDGGWGWSNAGLVTGDGTSLLVDTLFDLKLTRQMLDAMRAGAHRRRRDRARPGRRRRVHRRHTGSSTPRAPQ